MKTEALALHHFSIEGIRCSLCLKKLKALTSRVPGLKEVTVDMSRHTLKAQTSAEFDTQNFVRETEQIGFRARSIHISDEEEFFLKKKKHALLAKVGVAGALTGNIMLMSYSVYLGAPERFSQLFGVLSGLLFLPVLFYCASPFFESSWSSLRLKKPSIDLPLTLAILFGSLFSYFNLLRGHDHIYFDSLSALIFLILSSRYIVQYYQSKYLNPIAIKDICPSLAYSCHRGKDLLMVQGEQLVVDDRVQVLKGQIVPVDSILLSDSAFFDNSLLTGEIDPVRISRWQPVFAGCVSLSDDIEIKVTGSQQDSRLGKILDKLDIALSKDTAIVELTDSVAHYFTYGLFGVGALFFVSYSFVDIGAAFNRLLALLVIACPCALAITTPIVLRLSGRKALKNNFMVKQSDSFEKMSYCDAVVFDKTGTLTYGTSEVLNWWPQKPSEQDTQIIFSLEEKSSHPAAIAILRALDPQSSTRVEIHNFQEIAGVGVSGLFREQEYCLKKVHHDKGDIGFFKNGELVCVLQTQTTVRPEARQEVQKLAAMGLEIYLLTGDTKKRALALSEELKIKKEHVVADVSPEEKDRFIKKLSLQKNIIYVGDGLNDSLAMTGGFVGISMRQSVEATFSASQVHILKEGLVGLSKLYKDAKRTMRTIRSLLFLSFSYNVTFGFCALAGLINPLLAAILMPISSIVFLTYGIVRTERGGG